MGWYAASVILFTKFKDGDQNEFPVWENVVLVEAKTATEAMTKAERRGRMEEGDSSGTYSYDDRPAALVFAGIRKLIECEESEQKPGDGTEITYSRMTVKNTDDFRKLIQGESVHVLYEE